MSVDMPNRDLSLLAPRFRAAVEAAIVACDAQGLPVKVNEGFRSQARQAWLYAQGRTRPGNRVTNASTNLTSWHGYGLAVDVVHRTLAYWPYGRTGADAENRRWFAEVGAIFKAKGCNWGGDFASFPDAPHMQWGRCRPSPSARAKELIRTGGVQRVWQEVGAL